MGSSCSTNQRDEDEWCRPRITQSIKRKSKRKKKKKTTDHERRKHLIKVLSTEVQTSELLSRIPGRIVNNGSTSSACAFTQQGKKGTNQDAMVVWEHYASRKDTLLCGVFDGHGPYGHLVARRVRDTLPSKLMAIWKARMRGEIDVEDEDEEEDEDEDEEEEEEYVGYDGDIHNMRQQHANVRNTHHNLWDQHEQEEPRVAMKMWRECIAKTFCRMDRDLRIQPTIDCFCSGSTAVVLLQQGKELIMGNVGDSRAVLATFFCPDTSNVKAIRQDSAGTTSLRPVQLTLDLKPSLPREAERIRRCKGRVFALDDEPEVPRVWLPYDDAPGLAMARAFGDFCLKDYGLISVPDITYRTLTPDDQFVILATDGIWDVMSNRQAVEVVASAPSRVTAARFLVETAVRAWRLKYPTSKVDDCAVICLFFHHDASPIAQDRTSTTSSYYYTQEGEEDEDEEEEDTVTTACAPAAPAPTPEPASPAAHMPQSSAEGAQLQSNESEEISWGRTNTIRTPRHPNYVEDRVHRTPYDSYAEFDAITSPAFEIEEILPPSPTSKKQEAATSPARRSLAEYMLSSNPNDDEDDEWSALDGVVRVNSILNLPRFKVGDTPSLRKP